VLSWQRCTRLGGAVAAADITSAVTAGAAANSDGKRKHLAPLPPPPFRQVRTILKDPFLRARSRSSRQDGAGAHEEARDIRPTLLTQKLYFSLCSSVARLEKASRRPTAAVTDLGWMQLAPGPPLASSKLYRGWARHAEREGSRNAGLAPVDCFCLGGRQGSQIHG
jgi:hypothetical protein